MLAVTQHLRVGRNPKQTRLMVRGCHGRPTRFTLLKSAQTKESGESGRFTRAVGPVPDTNNTVAAKVVATEKSRRTHSGEG